MKAAGDTDQSVALRVVKVTTVLTTMGEKSVAELSKHDHMSSYGDDMHTLNCNLLQLRTRNPFNLR